MCNPAIIPLVVQVAGAALGAYSMVQSSQAQAAASEFDARIATRNAEAVEEERKNVADAAAIERRRLGEQIRAARGDANVKFAAMGLDPAFGTPADLIGDIETAGRTDAAIIGRNEMTEIGRLDKQEADYRDAASMGRSSAKSTRSAGAVAAGGSLLEGVANVSSRWIQPNSGAPASAAPKPAQRRPTSIFDKNALPVGG